jgi:L-malate glycosyltransferase
MEKIRIAYLIDTISCDTAGTQKQLLGIISHIDRNIFSPYLICLWKSQWMEHNNLPCDCTILGYKGFLKLNFFNVIRRFLKLISEKKFHIVQTFFEDSIFIGFLGGMLGNPRPILLSSRRDMGLDPDRQPWYHTLFKLALPFVNKYFSGIIANSEQVRNYVSKNERTGIEKIKVIFNGISFPDKSSHIPHELLDNKYLWIGIVASLTPVKRHDLLVRAFSKILKQYPTIKLRALFLGDGEQRDSLERLAKELCVKDNIYFKGTVKDVAAYLYQIDIGVLCSDREGLSNAILEYMACSLPIVATAVGGNIELVDEKNGILIPPNDVDSLENALLELIMDAEKRKNMGTSSFIKVRQKYSWQKSMNELENYYRSLIRI